MMGDSTLRMRRTVGAAIISLGTFAIMAFTSGRTFADTAAASNPTGVVPAPAVIEAPTADTTPTQSSTDQTSSTPTTTIDSAIVPDQTSTDTGGSVSATATNASTQSVTTNAASSTAQSGDATVDHNDSAGNAATGNAVAAVTTITSVGSSVIGGQNVTTFVMTVPSDSVVDLLVDPTQLAGSNASTTVSTLTPTTNGDTTTNVSACATSGNASVTNNGVAGNAATGNASTETNVLTLTDTNVSTPEFFVGTVNIYGNLTGNILLPSEFAGSTITPSISDPQTATPSIKVVDSITANAQSGSAAVEHNIDAGNALSGNAITNVTECNVIGGQLAGSGVVFVLINVQGQWAGFVMNGPTAAVTALGTNDASETFGASNVGNTTQTVTTNVIVSARSGDALVINNGAAGSATSGNAMASVELLNLVASTIKTSHWFGVLFINVFGNWLGGLATMPPSSPTTTSVPTTIPTPVTVVPLASTKYQGQPQHTATLTAKHFAAAMQTVASLPVMPANFDVSGQTLGAHTTMPVANIKGHELDMVWIVLGTLVVAETIVGVGYLRDRLRKHNDAQDDED